MFRHHFFLRNAASRGRNTRRFFADDSDMDPKGRDLELAYPLVNIYITIEWENQRTKLQFSIAMFVYQRVNFGTEGFAIKNEDGHPQYTPSRWSNHPTA